MSDTAVIELVDSEILASGADGRLVKDPGYALLGAAGIDTGEVAYHQAWLQPQHSFNQFWQRLSLAPLTGSNRFARHYADLAYAQLSHLHRQLDKPGEILFAIPGSFSRDQLAILLGLANALPVKPVGLVDTAVAVASSLDGVDLSSLQDEVLYLDIQLHQAVLTRLQGGSEVSRLAVEVLPDTGLHHFYTGWAQYIANLFIREYRYDPLHTAAGEQQLFSKLPGVLSALIAHPETSLELATPQGNFHLGLQRSTLLESSLPRIGRLRDLITRLAVNGPVVGSHRLGKLPGLDTLLNVRLLDEGQTIDACRRALTEIHSESDGGVSFVTRLPRLTPAATGQAPPPVAATAQVSRPTHLLHGHRAWPLGSEVGVEIREGAVLFRRDSQAPLLLRTANGRTWLAHSRYPVEVEGSRDDLRSGDLLRIEGHELRLIEAARES